MLPHDLPPHWTVYYYFRQWLRKGVWQHMHDQLYEQLRRRQGREKESTVAIADSQSVKTAEKRGRSMVSTVARKLRAVSDVSS
jgi:putative transposase